MSSNFSPVPPAQVKSLNSTKNIHITKLENTTKKDDTGQRESLRLTGKATPNSIVLIYIFSDPLILTTTAGKDGNWEYVLEDPLTPGKHEVYSAVDKGDGVYERSDPWSFVVGTAEASTSNPNGLSLRLAETPTPVQSKRSMLMYIAGSVTALLIAFGALIVIIKLNRHPAQVSAGKESALYQPIAQLNTQTAPQVQSAQEPEGAQAAKPSSEIQEAIQDNPIITEPRTPTSDPLRPAQYNTPTQPPNTDAAPKPNAISAEPERAD